LTGFDAGNRQTNIVVQNGRPRFLTLVEWERLMGFPDDWTAGLSDSARYAALGDAMMVNMADWLGRRLLTVHTSIPILSVFALAAPAQAAQPADIDDVIEMTTIGKIAWLESDTDAICDMFYYRPYYTRNYMARMMHEDVYPEYSLYDARRAAWRILNWGC
jgi:hypothetical protein